jgi:uncharacterized lipoprotein YajG
MRLSMRFKLLGLLAPLCFLAGCNTSGNIPTTVADAESQVLSNSEVMTPLSLHEQKHMIEL